MAAILLLSAVVFSGEMSDCSLCLNGDYNQNKLVPEFNMTCGSLELQGLIVGGDFCDSVHRHASWCECPGAIPGCIFCPVGFEPVNPDLPVMGATCGDINYVAHTADPNEFPCEIFGTIVDMCGGCAAVAPTPTPMNDPSVCSLCPNGEPVPFPNNLVFDEETTTCGQLEVFLPILNPFETCSIAHYIGVSQCGCNDTLPPIPPDAECYICEDGSEPTELMFEIFPDLTCRGLGYVIAMENETDTCTAAQTTAGAYCGCNNTKAEDVCRICGGDSLLPDPSRVVDLMVNNVPCLDLEFQANSGNVSCIEVQNTWAPICCPTDAPTVAPSDRPSAAPSVSPSSAPTAMPSISPSMLPSIYPSEFPSMLPSIEPSVYPSTMPSESPTMSVAPSDEPSLMPSDFPTESPAPSESFAPSESPAPSMAPAEEETSASSVVKVSIYSIIAFFTSMALLFWELDDSPVLGHLVDL